MQCSQSASRKIEIANVKVSLYRLSWCSRYTVTRALRRSIGSHHPPPCRFITPFPIFPALNGQHSSIPACLPALERPPTSSSDSNLSPKVRDTEGRGSEPSWPAL